MNFFLVSHVVLASFLIVTCLVCAPFSWQKDVFVVAEPGELADKFLQNVKFSLLSLMRAHHRRDASIVTGISNIADLVARRPCFQIGGVVHRYIGRQTQVYCLLGASFC